MYFVINENEQRELVHRGIVSSRLAGYWNDMVQKMPNDLKVEALGKAFQLRDHPVMKDENTRFSNNLYFHVNQASQRLQKELLKPENIVICMYE